MLLGSGRRGIVLGAQSNGGICQMLPIAQREQARGYHVAVFDWSDNAAADMRRATQALIAHGARRVVVGGFSRGALIGLGTAKQLGPRVVGVLSVSGGPSASDGFPTVRSLATFPGPILLITSEEDWAFPKGTSAGIAAAHKGEDTLLVVPGNGHALALVWQHPPEEGQVYAAIDAYLACVLAK